MKEEKKERRKEGKKGMTEKGLYQMESTKRVAEQLAVGPLGAYENLKALNYYSHYEDLEKYLSLETTIQTEAMQTEQFIEGTTAFLEKRTPNFNR